MRKRLNVKNLNCAAHYKPTDTEVYLEERIKSYIYFNIEQKSPYLEINPDYSKVGYITREVTFNLQPMRKIIYSRYVSAKDLDSLYTCLYHPESACEDLTLKCGDKEIFEISFRINGNRIFGVEGHVPTQYKAQQFLEWIYNHGFYWGRCIHKVTNNLTSKQIIADIRKRRTNKEAVTCVFRAGRRFHRFIEEK